MVDFTWDIETYPNIFSVVFADTENRVMYTFEISDRVDQREDLFKFCRYLYKNKHRMVGFNSLHFDSPVLHFLLRNKDKSVKQIYNYAMKIINAGDDEKFSYLVKKKDELIPQIDLFKIWHYDNKAKATSLKALEFVMRSDNIEDLPFPPGSKLSDEQKDVLLKYNKHDVYQTFLFYQKSLDQIRFREELSRKYKRDFMNHNDTKIGKDYFLMELEKAGIPCFDANRKPKQTKRDVIRLKECVLPYISFNRPEFQAVQKWLEKQEITKTKGVFSEILESDLDDLAQYANLRTKKKKLKEEPSDEEKRKLESEVPGSWVEPYQLKSGKTSWYHCWNVADNLNCVVDGCEYVYGTGGLHMDTNPQIIESDDEYYIKTADVSSMYPSIAIANNLYPEHLGQKFCTIYNDVYQQRKQYPKGTPENKAMKLALNGTYGASNDKYSPFFDPKFTMNVTIGGQLSLSVLVEILIEVPTVKMIMSNTDGVEFTVHKDYDKKCDEVFRQWESITGLELESSYYKKIALRDCNSYLAEDFDGNIKRKGAYDYELDFHQNQSMLVVPKAAEANLLYDTPIDDFIMNHKDIYDFMLRVKTPKSSRLVGHKDGEDVALQNITRYYVSNNGYQLVKCMPPANEYYSEHRIRVQSGWFVKPCNDIKNYDGDINYEFYIREAEKLVKPIKGG